MPRPRTRTAPTNAWLTYHPASLLPVLGWIVALEMIGVGIGIMTSGNIENWYAQLKLSPLNPPGWVFGVVWPMLYGLIAIAGHRLWQRRYQPEMKPLLVLFITQMVMNWAWSFLFFGAHMLWVSCFWLIALVAVVTILIIKAWRKERISACLLLPYLMWVSFATYLNGYIAVMN